LIENGGKAGAAVVMDGEGITTYSANQYPVWGGGREVDGEKELVIRQLGGSRTSG
jgi:hypothetical protein